tara:strand:+ start:4019 stop:4540 length:522 start_codon:yes stop_codon:yes gene_type:complete
MSDIRLIKDTPGYSIILDNEKYFFVVTLKIDVEYNEEGFEEFLLYFKNTWEYIKINGLTYHLLVNLGSSNKKENELPLGAYMKLIQVMTGINDIFIDHCHSVGILTEGSLKWKNAYELATKLWKPAKQRPLIFTEDDGEVRNFFNSHKLIPIEDVEQIWIPCEDGGYIRKRSE